MKNKIELYKALGEENIELTKKILKLEKFTKSDDFEELSAQQQRLLIIQHSVMLAYADILLQRMDDIND